MHTSNDSVYVSSSKAYNSIFPEEYKNSCILSDAGQELGENETQVPVRPTS